MRKYSLRPELVLLLACLLAGLLFLVGLAVPNTPLWGRFLAREGRGTFPYEWNGGTWELPCVRLDGTLIWGMTLRMLDDLLERVETA